MIPVGAPLKAVLDTATKRSTIIRANSEGKPWTSDGFRASWRIACAAAGVVGVIPRPPWGGRHSPRGRWMLRNGNRDFDRA